MSLARKLLKILVGEAVSKLCGDILSSLIVTGLLVIIAWGAIGSAVYYYTGEKVYLLLPPLISISTLAAAFFTVYRSCS